MTGYFIGLSAPSVTEARTTRLASPRSNSAGQTRFPTFSMITMDPRAGSIAVRARATISASRWQPVPVPVGDVVVLGEHLALERDRPGVGRRDQLTVAVLAAVVVAAPVVVPMPVIVQMDDRAATGAAAGRAHLRPPGPRGSAGPGRPARGRRRSRTGTP